MFTGIVETQATLLNSRTSGTNVIFTFSTVLDEPVKIDQSIAHNGVCLTVSHILRNEPDRVIEYEVTAVEETLLRTNLGDLHPGGKVNLERCLKAGQRLDGHFVQGHVDATGVVTSVEDRNGSWNYAFSFPENYSALLVDKGSVCINGVSLTVVQSGKGTFSVTIIPYTWEHTNFGSLHKGDRVNLEFDILGKYILKFQTQTN